MPLDHELEDLSVICERAGSAEHQAGERSIWVASLRAFYKIFSDLNLSIPFTGLENTSQIIRIVCFEGQDDRDGGNFFGGSF